MEHASMEYIPEYQDLNLEDLLVDKYQRKLTYADCKRYSKKFDTRKIGVLLVSFRDGKYYLVDGQHRCTLLKMKGYRRAFCQVIRGLTYQEESELFKEFNTERRQLGRADLLIAELESGHDKATNIVNSVSKYGYTFPRVTDIYGLNGKVTIQAVAAVQQVYNVIGEEGINSLFDLTNSTWPSDANAVKRNMITGMGALLKKFPTGKIDKPTFVAKLSKTNPLDILKQAEVDSKYTSTNSERPDSVARVIWSHYNKGLPKKRQLPYSF